VPQLGKNGLQLGCVLCGYCLGTQFADSLLQGYIERHKAPLVYMYLGPGDSSIPYTLYFQVNVTSRDLQYLLYWPQPRPPLSLLHVHPKRAYSGHGLVSAARSFFIRCDIRTLTTA
jgi:hypothetical protein